MAEGRVANVLKGGIKAYLRVRELAAVPGTAVGESAGNLRDKVRGEAPIEMTELSAAAQMVGIGAAKAAAQPAPASDASAPTRKVSAPAKPAAAKAGAAKPAAARPTPAKQERINLKPDDRPEA